MSPRYKILICGVASFLAVWVIAFGVYHIASGRKVTIEKVRSLFFRI